MIFRKDELALRRTDRRYDSLWQFVWVWDWLLVSSPVMSPFSLVNETPRAGIYDNRDPFGGPVFRQINSFQRKPLPALAVSQVPTTQNNQYPQETYLGLAYSTTFQWKCFAFWLDWWLHGIYISKIYLTVHQRFLYFFVKLHSYNLCISLYKIYPSKTSCSLCCFVSWLHTALSVIQSNCSLTVLLLQSHRLWGSCLLMMSRFFSPYL